MLPQILDIEVTSINIKKGIRGSYKYCPIALAIKRTLSKKSKKYNVFIESDICIISGHIFPLPERAQNFISKFDSKNEVKPFRFKIKEKKRRLWQ